MKSMALGYWYVGFPKTVSLHSFLVEEQIAITAKDSIAAGHSEVFSLDPRALILKWMTFVESG